MPDTRHNALRAPLTAPVSVLESGLFRAHFEHLPGPAYIWERSGEDFRLITHNRAAGQLSLSRIRELIGIGARELFVNQPQILSDLYECARTGLTVARETDLAYTAGRVRKIAMTCVPLTSDIVVIHTHDITDRFEADRALRASEQRYRTIVDNAHEGIWVTDRESVTTFINRHAAEILGYSPEDMIGRPTLEFVPPELLDEAKARQKRFRAGSKELFEFVLLHRDGRPIWVSAAAAPLFDGEGDFVGGVAMLSDITQRRNDEMALRASEEKFRRLLEGLPELVTRVDRGGRHLDAHLGGARGAELPYLCEQLIGRTFAEVFGEELGAEHRRRVRAALESGEPQLWDFELESGGSVRHMEARFTRISDDEVVIICRDNTERVDLEREVVAIGERERNRIGRDLHDGLAQLLTGVELLLRSLTDKLADEQSAYVAEARRASALVQHALEHTSEIARGLSPIPKGAKLSDGLIQLAAYSQRFFGIECRYAGSRRLPALAEDASANLYRIAQEGITNAVRHGKASAIELRCRLADGRITLTITDDGTGMPDSDSATNGMGLQIMRYRARSLGGSLTIARGSRGGTVVTCRCPVSRHSA
jgi:PAS domain S-box-containing protein